MYSYSFSFQPKKEKPTSKTGGTLSKEEVAIDALISNSGLTGAAISNCVADAELDTPSPSKRSRKGVRGDA